MTQQNRTIIFVCEHGAAKSIIAAALFNQLAQKAEIDLRAIARGTNPDPSLSPRAVEGLSKEGLEPTERIPIKISLEELHAAQRVISFCELPLEYRGITPLEQWEDVPPVSEDYEKARSVIVRHLEQLLDTIRRTS